MKKFIPIFIIATILLSSCSHQPSASGKLLNEAEKLIKVNPDSASILLKRLSSSDSLNDKDFARWCMLSGKVTDKIFNSILPTYQLERAYIWYSHHGTPAEQVQMLIYLGRSHFTDGDYDKAMSIYTNAIDIGNKNKLHNLLGYTYTYMGDLYREKFMFSEAIKKYQTAAGYFKKGNNTDSYACALKDIGQEYACMDSLSHALEILTVADSVAVNSQDKDVKAAINNVLGNIYAMQNEYEKAEKYFFKALGGREKMPTYIALIDLYIAADSINKAQKLLSSIPQDNPEYTYSIKYLYYQIYQAEKNYKEALSNLEEYVDMVDSIVYAANQSKILDIESKYNHLKIKQEVDRLKLKQQSNKLSFAICISFLLLILIAYLVYRKKAKEKIQKQQTELSHIKIEFLNLSLDLEKKKRLLATFKEKEESYNNMQEEITLLTSNYKKLQRKMLTNSPIYKHLELLASPNKPRSSKLLQTNEQWEAIKKEIMSIYPNLLNYIYNRCSELTEEDLQYCCLYLYGFDTNAEAKLLGINVESVRRKRSRLRIKLNITLPKSISLYQYLIENMD